MWFFGKKRRAKKEAKRLKEEQELKEAQMEKEPKAKEKNEPANKAPKKVEPKAAPKKVLSEEVNEEDDETKDDKTPSKAPKYHVSQNKDPRSEFFKKWRVRKEGSQKTIKFYDTQLEAIKSAEDLAEKAGSSVVIHKMDGSIRKQDYSKK